MQNNTNLFNSILGTTGASIAVLALGKAKPIVWFGAVTVLLKELKDLSTSYDQKTQLDAMPSWNKSTKIQVCPASDWIKTTLGYRDLKVLADIKIDTRSLGAPSSKPESTDFTREIERLGAGRLRINSSVAEPSKIVPTPRKDVPAIPEKRDANKYEPPQVLKFNLDAPSDVVRGTVTDRGCYGCVVPGAVVQLVAEDNAQDWIATTANANGEFAFFRLSHRGYILSVFAADFYTRSVRVAPGSGAIHNLNIGLQRRSQYPCDFTFYNQTSWWIDVYSMNYGWELVGPFSSVSIRTSQPDMLYPEARFKYVPWLFWKGIAVNCDGNGFASILPPQF
jgi:hypothetical protein